jgi:probable HAF family extracellular repeat protein
MHRLPRTALVTAIGATLALAGATGQAAGNVRFTVTDLGTLGGTTSRAYALNDSGVVVGQSAPLNLNGQAFRWANGSMQQLADGFVVSEARAIDNFGTIVGRANGEAVVFARPFPLTVPQTSRPAGAWGVSSSYVVGETHHPNGSWRAFYSFNGGNASWLDNLSNQYAYASANAVNGQGEVAGYNAGGTIQRAVVWRQLDGLPRDLDPGTLGPTYQADATALNAKGNVVGWRRTEDGAATHAFFYSASQGGFSLIPGDTGPGLVTRESRATGVNAADQVVGNFSVSGGGSERHGGFIWAGGARIDLNSVLAVGSPTLVDNAAGINSHGQIAANGSNGHALLLTPTGTVTWQGPNNGLVADRNNWDSGGLGFGPNAFLQASIDSPTALTVRLSDVVTTPLLLLGATNALGQVTLDLDNGTLKGRLLVGSEGVLTGSGTVEGEVSNLGWLELRASGMRLSAGLVNDGVVIGAGTLYTNLTNQSTGTVVATNAQSLTIDGSLHLNNGLIQVNASSRLFLRGEVLNGAAGRIELGGQLSLRDGLSNSGEINFALTNTPARLQGDVHNQAGGRIELARSGAAEIDGDLINDGLVTAGSASTLRYLGRVSGDGSFIAGTGARHVFVGSYAPGHSAAAVSLSQAEFSGTLALEIGGLVAGSGHDHITFTSNVWFNAGSFVDVVLIDGFSPTVGADFALFGFARAPAASAAMLRLSPLAAGLVWDSSTLFTDGHLRVAAVPEPVTLALWLLGLCGVCALRPAARRRAFDSTH